MVIETAVIGAGSVAGAWAWENYGKDLTNKVVGSLTGKAKERWEKSGWEKAKEAYKKSLRRQHAKIRVLGKSSDVDLEGIFTDVYILDEVTARQAYDIEELKKQHSARLHRRTPQREKGINLITDPDYHHLYILGKPGAGKTTFLRHLTLQAIDGNLDRVPIFISLKEWSDSDNSLLDFITKQFDNCHFPDAAPFITALLNSGQALIMFDGLDEVRQEDDKRQQSINALQDFSDKYYTNQILITCRIAASHYQFEGFQDVEISDFTESQQRSFIEKWFVDNPEKLKSFIEDFYKKEENEPIRELGNIPLLLSLLCINYDRRMNFPKRRADLYNEALDALLETWDSSRNIKRGEIYKDLSRNLKQAMFASIAAKTFPQGDYFIRRQRLENMIAEFLNGLSGTDIAAGIDGRAVLKAIEAQHSIFVERAKDIYAFSHLTFQEYYLAKYIVDHEAEGATERLLNNHLLDNRWREVFLLTASLLNGADKFFILFRQKLDKLVMDNELLVNLLEWFKKKRVSDLNDPFTLTLTLDRASALVFNLAHTRDHALTLAHALASDLDRDLASVLTRALASDLDRVRELANYLGVIRLLVECLGIAGYVSNRQAIEESLFRPPGEWKIKSSKSLI